MSDVFKKWRINSQRDRVIRLGKQVQRYEYTLNGIDQQQWPHDAEYLRQCLDVAQVKHRAAIEKLKKLNQEV